MCRLVGGAFAVLVQVLLCVVAFVALVAHTVMVEPTKGRMHSTLMYCMCVLKADANGIRDMITFLHFRTPRFLVFLCGAFFPRS